MTDDTRDTLPPSSDDLRVPEDVLAVGDKTNRELLAMVICGLEQVRRTTESTHSMLLEQHEDLRAHAARIEALERDRFWGSRLPLALAAVALSVALCATGVSAVGGWVALSQSARAAP